MKTWHIGIILVAITIASVGIYTFLPHIQSSFPVSYANLELVGINDTYNTSQVIKFQVKATGLEFLATCQQTIYKSDQPSVIVFEKKIPHSCVQ